MNGRSGSKEFEFNLPSASSPASSSACAGLRASRRVGPHAPGPSSREGRRGLVDSGKSPSLDLDELHEGRLEDYDGGLSLAPADMTTVRPSRRPQRRAVETPRRFPRAAQFRHRLEALDEGGRPHGPPPRLRKQMRGIDMALSSPARRPPHRLHQELPPPACRFEAEARPEGGVSRVNRKA